MSSKLTLTWSSSPFGGVGASAMEMSWVSGSDFTVSTREMVRDESSAGVDSGLIECGILKLKCWYSFLRVIAVKVWRGRKGLGKRDSSLACHSTR
jgi:hypothetical protein